MVCLFKYIINVLFYILIIINLICFNIEYPAIKMADNISISPPVKAKTTGGARFRVPGLWAGYV